MRPATVRVSSRATSTNTDKGDTVYHVYQGRITAKQPHPTGLMGRDSSWTCAHAHNDMGAAFECAVNQAKRGILKSPRGMQSQAKRAGIRELTIGFTMVPE